MSDAPASSSDMDLPLEASRKGAKACRAWRWPSQEKLFPRRNTKYFDLDLADAVLVFLLTAIGAYTRTFRVQQPKSIVYGEASCGQITNCYIKGVYFHTEDPPLGQMILAAMARRAGYNGEFRFESQFGKNYPSMLYVSLRMMPAIVGGLCVPLMYIACRAICLDHFSSFVAGALANAEFSLIAQDRLHHTDSFFHFSAELAILAVFLHDRMESVNSFAFMCICLGCAVATKTASIGIVCLAIAKQFMLRDSTRLAALRTMVIVLAVVAICYTAFSVHLNVLPYYPTDQTVIPEAIRRSLVNESDKNWRVRVDAPPMIERVFSLVFTMLTTKGNFTSQAHASMWYQWPLHTTGWIPMWEENNRHSMGMGNVFVWLPVFVSVIGNLMRKVFNMCDIESFQITLGYLFSLAPFVLFPSNCYLFNYSLPLIFGIINLVLFINRFLSSWQKGYFLAFSAFTSTFGLILWSPVVYSMETNDYNFFVLFPIWNKFHTK